MISNSEKTEEEEETTEKKQLEPFVPKYNLPMKTDLEDLLQNAKNSGDNTTRRLTIETSSWDNKPFDDASINLDHSIILLNLCHNSHRPMHKYPGFRILGAFPNMNSLQLHVKKYYEHTEASLWATPVHQLMTICKSTEDQINISYNKKQIERLVEIYEDAADTRNREFKENVENQKSGAVGQSIYKSKIICKETIEKNGKMFDEEHKNDKIDRIPHDISFSGKIVNQSFAVIITLSDIRKVVKNGKAVPEPCIAILDVFESETSAIQYSKTTASKLYPKCDIDIVDMYSWNFPENINPDKITELYSQKRLNDVMNTRKQNNEMAEDFEGWCASNNVEQSVIEI
jgi:hypothetical protein